MSPAAPFGTTQTVKPISDLFNTDVIALWATTFNLDLALYNEYLLRRLGDPPLNAVVLADRSRLDTSLASIPRDRLDLIRPVNRRWLLRGIRIGSGIFHPKSYLAVRPGRARLLVGSGNLAPRGVDQGREVFTTFDTGTAVGDSALQTWRMWMRRLVEELDDTVLAERFADLEVRLPRPPTVSPVLSTPLWHNLDETLFDQFCERVLEDGRHVDELLVTAPFYDPDGEALGRLVDRLNPDRLRLYLTGSTSVDGAKLSARLDSTGSAVTTFSYMPDRFTHAKLVGALTGNSGWLMSGSPNLSHAALRRTAGSGGGNVELAVISGLDAETLRAVFLPPDTEAEERPYAMITGLEFMPGPDETPDPGLVRIVRAELVDDEHVQVFTHPAPDPGWRLADHQGFQPLRLDPDPHAFSATTRGPLPGHLVHLTNHEGIRISNHAVVEDRNALRRALQAGERSDRGRPAELSAGDLDSPLGKALEYLHVHLVMDVSEIGGRGAGAEVTGDEAATTDTDDLWERLDREKIGRDPRAGTYDRLFREGFSHTGGADEPLIQLLETLRDRAPAETGLQAPAGSPPPPAPPGKPGSGASWTTTARVRVRARNVLRRWAAAQTDPRLTWVNPLAPLGNLRYIAAMLVQLWHKPKPGEVEELASSDLEELWELWFRPFVGTGKADGWLDRVDVDNPKLAEYLTGQLAHDVTALCWLAIRPGKDLRSRRTAWQPYLRAALDKDLIDCGNSTLADLTKAGFVVDSDQVETQLLETVEYIDDELWCQLRVADLGLGHLALKSMSAGQQASVRLDIAGIDHPLHDPRIPGLIGEIRQYRNVDAVALYGDESSWRIVVATGNPVSFMAGIGKPIRESEPLESNSIAEIVAAQGTLANLFAADVLADLYPSGARVA